ncbi:MAG: pyridoxal phosphate-dependent aminotransferase [Candidatus Sericytochromatia bacterium]|nr:pyridoxal phosphate-dependent aminotransferase [Candidatus Tanganyikabacteria bacterium]
MNPRLEAIPGSLIRELNARKRPEHVDLGLGEPLLLPDASLLAEAAAWAAESGCRYGPNAGLPEPRAAVASYLGDVAPDRVILTNGSQEAIFLAIKTVCDPARHEVLVVEPAYPLYRKIAQLEGIACRSVACEAASDFAFDPAAILAEVTPATRLIVVCSPCNPTGRIAGAAILGALAAGLERLSDPPYVLMDEAYRELYYTPEAPPRMQAFYSRTLVAGSLSKSNALTGLRLGWLLAPEDFAPLATKVHQFLLTSANVVGQRVAQLLLERALLGAHRPHYARQRAAFEEALRAHGLAFVPPEGAFYALVRLPPRLAGDSIAAARALVDEGGVVAIPGRAFGACAEGFLRCSFVAAPPALAAGAKRIAGFVA